MNKEQKLKLRKLSHQLKPVVMIGVKELTDAVLVEIDRALETHELIKIRISARDKEHRVQMTQEVCESCYQRHPQTHRHH